MFVVSVYAKHVVSVNIVNSHVFKVRSLIATVLVQVSLNIFGLLSRILQL